MKTSSIELTKTEANQLLSYVEAREREMWYYGNRTQFEVRHATIKAKLTVALKEEG